MQSVLLVALESWGVQMALEVPTLAWKYLGKRICASHLWLRCHTVVALPSCRLGRHMLWLRLSGSHRILPFYAGCPCCVPKRGDMLTDDVVEFEELKNP